MAPKSLPILHFLIHIDAYKVPLSTSDNVKSNTIDLIEGTSDSLKLVTLAKLINESNSVNVGIHLLATVREKKKQINQIIKN